MIIEIKSRIAIAMLGVALLAPGYDAFAAPAPAAPAAASLTNLNIPSSADASRVVPDNTEVPEPTAPIKPAIKAAPQPTVDIPPGADQVKFVLKHLTIEGMTAYKQADIAPLYKDYTDKEISLATIYKVAGEITNRYHQDGYTLSQAVILPQEISDGLVKIRVVEGFINEVTMEGSYHHSFIVEKIAARLRLMKPLKVSELERAMLILNDMGNVSVRAVLKAPDDPTVEAGAVNLALVFTDIRRTTSLTFDNSGSRYVGPYEMGAQTTFTNALMPYQQTTINGLTTVPPKEMQYLQLSQRMLLSSNGTSATLQITGVHNEPGYHLASEHIESTSVNSSLSVSYPLIRSRAQNLYLDGEFDVNNSTTDVLGGLLNDDRLRILRFGANYDGSDRFKGSNVAQIKVSQGLDILDERKTGSSDLSRADGHSDFTKITASIGRLQSISDKISFYISGQGQYAWNPLLSSEQFGFGGQQYGRAYDSSEFTGDDGIEGMAEFRYALTRQFWHMQSEPFVFTDMGRVWDYNAYSQGHTAASAGVGWRFTNQHNLTAAITVAQPLMRPVAAPQYGSGFAPRVFISLNLIF